MRAAIGLLMVGFLLAACGEKPQASGGKKVDQKAWAGASDGFVAPGWKPGDEASWEQHMKSRMQGQNEYSRSAS